MKFSNDLGTWPVLAVLFFIALAVLTLIIALMTLVH